jgi:hypothetical protein
MEDKWIKKNAKSEPGGPQREPKGSQKGATREPNGVGRSCVKTPEIDCNIVLKHKGGNLDPPLCFNTIWGFILGVISRRFYEMLASRWRDFVSILGMEANISMDDYMTDVRT